MRLKPADKNVICGVPLIYVTWVCEVHCMIYLSHCLSAWGDRMWDFAVGLYMIILYPESLLVTAILGFVTALAVITFGSLIGAWIDKTKRITSASAAIIVQNLTIALAGSGLSVTFLYTDEIRTTWNGKLLPFIFALVILASVISKLASVASDIVIEQDWIVVLTNGDDKNLATMNSVMRTIDLTTKILAPVAIGALISFWSPMASAIFVAGWNLVSGFLELYLLVLIYKRVPSLGKKDVSMTKPVTFREYWGGWREYFSHPVKVAGVAFSCLFMTALGFDQVTTGYLFHEGVDESLIGILTAFAAIVGIIGSVAYPFLRTWLGKDATAILGYILNSLCLSLCVVSIFMPGSPFEPSAIFNGAQDDVPVTMTIKELWEQNRHIFFFIGGVVLARFGLWVADLSTCQLLQDTVEESKRGIINGVQNSMNQFMDMIKFVLVIALPSARTFGYLIIATWIFGCLGCFLYVFYSMKGSGKSSNLQSDTGNVHDDSASNSTETTPLLHK